MRFSILLCALAITFIPLPARAYMDPGTGSYLLQILLAGLLATGFALKMFWQRIKAFFSRKDASAKPDDPDENAS